MEPNVLRRNVQLLSCFQPLPLQYKIDKHPIIICRRVLDTDVLEYFEKKQKNKQTNKNYCSKEATHEIDSDYISELIIIYAYYMIIQCTRLP